MTLSVTVKNRGKHMEDYEFKARWRKKRAREADEIDRKSVV